MKSSISKIVNALLAIGALICFFSVNFLGYHGKTFSGGDYLEMCEDTEEFWPFLYILIPIIQVIVRFIVEKKKDAIICSFFMFIPIFATLFNVDPEYLQEGFYLYGVITIAMIVVASYTETENLNGENLVTANDKTSQLRADIRNNYSRQQLCEIIENSGMYNESLVEECRRELDIRTEAEKIMPEARTYTQERIKEILSDRSKYSTALVYCCSIIAQEIESQRIEEDRKRKEEVYKKNIAWWKKWGWAVGLFVVVVIVLIVVADSLHTQKINRQRIETAKEQVLRLNEQAVLNTADIDEYIKDIELLVTAVPELVTQRVESNIEGLKYEISEAKRRAKLMAAYASNAQKEGDTPEEAEERVENADDELWELNEQIDKVEDAFNVILNGMAQEANSNYQYGNKYSSYTNYARANDLFRKGYKYSNDGDYSKAIEFYHKAISYGHPTAIGNLGVMFDNGEGVPEDNKIAFLLYRVGFNAGEDHAGYNLALCYEFGQSGVVEEDLDEAKKIYRRIAARGHKAAREKCRELNIYW